MPHVRKDSIAARDSTVIARLRAAGAVILGKLQLTEGAVAHHHPDVPPPLNPHNTAFWSGASSSGSGVATAAGLCFGALGSDTGGSIRFPCFANGVTGIKPTWGRVSRTGVVALAPSLDHIGPMARSAADCGAILAAIAGPDPDDPTALRAPVPDYLAGLGRGLGGLRVGFDEAYATEHVAPAITRAIREAIEVLCDAGATIKPVKLPSTDAVNEAWFAIFGPEAAVEHAATYATHADVYGPRLKQMVEAGTKFSGSDYARAHNVRQIFAGQLDALFEQVDVVLAPAGMRHTMTLAEFDRFGSKDSDWPDLLRFAAPYNMSGTPALPLPCGIDPDGVPFGFQLLARHLNEKALIRAGDAYQRATTWHQRRPPLAK
jgi:amidase